MNGLDELNAWRDSRVEALLGRARAEGLAGDALASIKEQETSRLSRVVLASDYATDLLSREAVSMDQWLEDAQSDSIALPSLNSIPPNDEAAAMRALRHARARAQLRLITREALGLDAVDETLLQSSQFADASVQWMLDWLRQGFESRFGAPQSQQHTTQSLCVFGLGKLGGHELNFSSDIDLIFAFPEAGQSSGPRVLDNEEYFSRLGQKLIPMLSEVTSEGFVHRVDMRLRPFGSAGRLALSFAGMEQYYQTEGRDWERYAWIKARCIAGDVQAGAKLIDTLRPFVYRRYLDYTAIEGLRAMKAMIDAEVERKELHDNLKLGKGGIREIEFMVQLAQLIRGGREPSLRTPRLREALDAAVALGHFSADDARDLHRAYGFLRRLENRVQMLSDQQTHDLPTDEFTQWRLAVGLGFDSRDAFLESLDVTRERVASLFAQTLEQPRAATANSDAQSTDWSTLLAHLQSNEQASEVAVIAPFGAAAWQALIEWLRGTALRTREAAVRTRVERLMPLLLADLASGRAPDLGLQRCLRFLQTVIGRPSYLALLIERPSVRKRVMEVFAEAGFLAERIQQNPVLLDELIDARRDIDPGIQAFELELARRRKQIDADDVEEWIVALQEERDAALFRLGLGLRDGTLNALQVAKDNARIAGAVVAEVLALSRRDLSKRFPAVMELPFAVIGYGSLGGDELGFASDLDLVFMFGAGDGVDSALDEATVLQDQAMLANKLAQRILHWLSTQTRAGTLYEVDMRLRPDGSKGLLVTSVQSFVAYQIERAWLWEHQALVRARAIAGSDSTRAAFERARERILKLPRERAVVLREVASMRERWRSERDRSDAERFDLKQGRGGLVDLEFCVQAEVLAGNTAGQGSLLPVSTDELLACLELNWATASNPGALPVAHRVLLHQALICQLNGLPRLCAPTPTLREACSSVTRACEALFGAFDHSDRSDDAVRPLQ